MNNDNKSLSRMALNATLHCLTGCAVGEIAGLILGMSISLSTSLTILLATILAFAFGFTFSTFPLLKTGIAFFTALGLVFAADSLSIATMEVVDNLVMAIIPGAMNAGLVNPLFWITMPISLGAAFLAAYPVNKYLLKKNKGHALVMKYHDNHQQ